MAEWLPALTGYPVRPCPDKLDRLTNVDLVYPIRYAHRDIIVNPSADKKRAPVTRVDEPLFPDFQVIDLTENAKLELRHCAEPLVLDVPLFMKDPPDASHLTFGISTTMKRLDGSIPSLVRWLPGTHAKLFVIVTESEGVGVAEGQEGKVAIKANEKQKEELQAKMKGLDMDVTLVHPLELQDEFSEKYFSLIKIMYDNRNDKTQWITMLDDDTFFPSIPALISMLGKYDPQEYHYIGGLSEDWWSVTKYGMMGFGGAGIFLSIALADILASNHRFCKDTSHTSAGDIRVMECIHQLTDTKLETEHSLHQIDLAGDLSGFYESGRLPLSLHHWKTRGETMFGGKGYNLPMMHLVSDICGDCFLQRWQFGKDMVLSNGYSIAIYPNDNLRNLRLEAMEETWSKVDVVEGSDNHGIDHSLAPTRPRLALDEEKIHYRLVDSGIVDGGVRQSYLHRGLDGDIDSLFELFWMRS